jgi:hypothetical protein
MMPTLKGEVVKWQVASHPQKRVGTTAAASMSFWIYT